MQTPIHHYEPQPWKTTKLIFVMGDFYNREELRRRLVSPADGPSFEEAPYISRKDWTDATFAAYQNPNEPNPIKRADTRGTAFDYFRTREHKVLLITHQLQEEIRNTEPVYDEWGELPLSKFGGIIPYNHKLIREVREKWDHSPKALSMVVSKNPSDDLEASVNTEFADGADIFLVGERDPKEYLQLIKSFFGGNINPRNYQNMFFNPARFEETRNHLLVSTHSYN